MHSFYLSFSLSLTLTLSPSTSPSELVNAARKALISRVEELTNERSALKVEVTSCLETVTRLEGRMKEMEEETKRYTTLVSGR